MASIIDHFNFARNIFISFTPVLHLQSGVKGPFLVATSVAFVGPHISACLAAIRAVPSDHCHCNRQKNLELSSTKQKSQQSMPLLIICINTIYGAQCPNKDIASQIFMHRPIWVRNYWANNYLRFYQLSRNCFQKSFLCDAGVLWGIENTTNFYRKELLAIYIS